MMMNKMVKPSELRVRDVVKVFGVVGYDTATVVKVEEDRVHLVRPYVHTDSLMEYDGCSRVIDYIGTERFFLWKSHQFLKVQLVERRNV